MSRLLEGKKRVVKEIQILYETLMGRVMPQQKAKQTFERICGIIFDEVFQYGKFVFPKGYGQIYIKERKRKIFPDREYKRLVVNYEDETGQYNLTYVIRFRPGTKIQERVRQYKKKNVEAYLPPSDDDFMKVLTYLTESDDEC